MSDEAVERVSPSMGDAPAGETTRPSRRAVVKAGVAVVGGVAAASYVKPTLSALGVPTALAISGGGNNCWLSCTPQQVEKDIEMLLSCIGGGFPLLELIEILIEELEGTWSQKSSCNSDDKGNFQNSFHCTFPSSGSYRCTATCNSPAVTKRFAASPAGASTIVTAATTITVV